MQVAALAEGSGWTRDTERWVLWELPIDRLIAYRHARVVMNAQWTAEPLPDIEAQAASLPAWTPRDEGQFQT